MIQNGLTSQEYHDAYSELLKSCSDTEPCPVPTPQPTVTISTNSTAPTPPSTPKPLGPEWWRERQAEALQEQIEIIKAQAQKIQSLQKQIAENNAYWDNKAVIEGCCEHNDELVAANVEIYEALKHWGLDQSGPCSLVDNVKHVIQLCADRGKAHFDLKDKIERLNDQIDSQSKVIAELTNQRDGWEKLAAKRSGEMNRRSDMIDIMEKQCDQKDKEIESKTKVIESLKKSIEVLDRVCKMRQRFADSEIEVNHKKTVEIEELAKQLSLARKKRQAIVEVGNKLRDRLRIMANQYYLLEEEHVENSNAIALWDDNTTP
jgi:DNA repair exonuclease SbcCD ATPase subunit